MRDLGSYYVEYGRMNSSTNMRIYKVEMKKQCTVDEFITEWCDNNISEWGTFKIKDENNGHQLHSIEYENGKFRIHGDSQRFLNKTVVQATGRGGWGNSDFNLYVV